MANPEMFKRHRIEKGAKVEVGLLSLKHHVPVEASREGENSLLSWKLHPSDMSKEDGFLEGTRALEKSVL